MDSKIKKTCPNCSQLYQFKSISNTSKSNIPLFLSCGHSMCEKCVRNIVKFSEPIECKVCHRDMIVEASDVSLLTQNKIDLYSLFPVNIFMLGELTLEGTEQKNNNDTKEDVYINLKEILESLETNKGSCLECHSPTSKMCQQCSTILCEQCFNKSHKNFIIFKNHVLQNIEITLNEVKCKTHREKPLDYYCKDCSKAICMDCMMVGGDKSCKNHDIVAMNEVNDGFLEEVNDLAPKVDEKFRRLTKTAVKVGDFIHNIENETDNSELRKVISDVEQHFSKLMYTIQKHKTEVINIITKLKSSEKASLYKAKNDIADSITRAKIVQNVINLAFDPNKKKQVNLSVLADDCKQIVNYPWYLNKDEATEHPLKIAVNEDLCNLISDYIQLEGNANSSYKLHTTEELGEGFIIPPAPTAPVFPPVLPKDVRQKNKKSSRASEESTKPMGKTQGFYTSAPKYRSKSGSTTSINSIGSDSSFRTATTNESYNKPLVHQVQPFPESQHPKQLQEGSQELIYITHIVDLQNFYVQRSCYQKVVKDMLREFRNATALPQPSQNHIAEGKLYLAYNNADKMWQRCRVLSIDRSKENAPLLHVFCIDFGSTETVPLKKIRLLPPARVQSPPPLAINCSLANCKPIAGSWTNDDSVLLQNIINNKQAVILIRHIRSTPNYGIQYDVDVTTLEEGINIADALVFHECAKLVNPSLRNENVMALQEQPKIFTNSCDFKHKDVEQVFVTHIVSPDKFYVRKCHLQSTYEKLNEELQQEYCLAVTSGTVYLPELGMACIVNVEKYLTEDEVAENGSWARGIVTGLPGRARVQLLLPDSGKTVLAHCSSLRQITHKFTTFSTMAKKCYLAGVTPLNKKWSRASVALLEKFQERQLELQVEDTRSQRGAIGVTLYDKTDEENIICLNQEMIKHKFAVSFGIFMFNKNPVEEQVRTKKGPLDKPSPKPKTRKQITLLKKATQPNTSKIQEKLLVAKDKGPIRLEAKVLQYQSPSLIYVSLVHQQKTFNELFDNIQKYYANTKTLGKDTWIEGDRCCTLCIQSQTWRRAVIIELDSEKAKVFYSDFAVVEIVPTPSLRELTPDFYSIGDAAIKCHLCGVIPAVGEEWPSLTKEYLKELLDAYKRVFITKIGDFKNKSMPVEVWAYHTMQGGALEANTSEWRCLNKKIIDQGLGIPDKLCEVQNTETVKEDELSFLNLTGSVQEWLQLEPTGRMPTMSIATTKSETETTSSTHDDADLVEKDDGAESSKVFISDWLPPEPFQSDEFTGMPTYIDNDGIIYLHDMTQQDTLDLIRKALDVRFKNPDPKAKYAKWIVGEPCIALYYLDNRFYRARVTSVNNENSTCTVQYVDYGNEEICSFINMRKTIAIYQIPVQAHKCILNRIRPVNGQWNRTALDYIHKSTVEKQCFIKVTGEATNDIVPVDLKYNKLWINDHLVEFEMAEYTDGSIAKVPQFVATSRQSVPEPVEVDSDSGPDFIIEDEISELDQSKESFDTKHFEHKDWNSIMEDEDKTMLSSSFLNFPKIMEKNFVCNITVINDVNTLELNILHSDDIITEEYDSMFENLQEIAEDMLPLDGVFENKACIALYPEDGGWYRASILQYSEEKQQIKVRYVDYGNIEIISLSDAREIIEDFTKLPPATVSAKLHNVALNPSATMDDVVKEYTNTFLDKGQFFVNVIEDEDLILSVELKNKAGELIYEHLIGNVLKFVED